MTAVWAPTETVYYVGTFTLSAARNSVSSFSVSLPSDSEVYGLPSASPSTGGPLQPNMPIQITVSLRTGPPTLLAFPVTVKGPANTVTVTVSPYFPPIP